MTMVADDVTVGRRCVERRRDQRLCVSLHAVVSMKDSGGAVTEDTRLVNVSAGGAYFGSDADLDVGEDLSISILVPQAIYMANPPARFAGRATVVRVNRESPPPGKRAGVGVRFNGGLTFRTAGE